MGKKEKVYFTHKIKKKFILHTKKNFFFTQMGKKEKVYV